MSESVAAARWLQLLIVAAGAAAGVSFLIVGLLATAMVRRLPDPTGKYAIGTTTIARVAHLSGWTQPTAADCRLQVRLFYPADASVSAVRAHYDPAASIFSARRWLRMAAAADVPAVGGGQRFPVLLFLPGWRGVGRDNTSLVQDLASRGFVVAAIDYSAASCGPGNVLDIPDLDLSSPSAYARTRQFAFAQLGGIAAAVAALVDALVMSDGPDRKGLLAGRLDLTRLAAVGYSFGGAIAVQLSTMDPRVQAAVDIDGWLFDAPTAGAIRKPLLFISDDGAPPTAADRSPSADDTRRYTALLDDETEQRLSVAAQAGFATITKVDRSSHADFSDLPYLSHRSAWFGRTPDGRIIRSAADMTESFLRRTWKVSCPQSPCSDAAQPLAPERN